MTKSICHTGGNPVSSPLTCVLVLCGMALVPASQRATVLAEPTATNPPILLIVNSAAPNKFGAYLGEILRAEGLNAFDQVALE